MHQFYQIISNILIVQNIVVSFVIAVSIAINRHKKVSMHILNMTVTFKH